MPDIEDGAVVEIKGSAREPYILKNTGGVYSCTCPAWRNQSIGIEQRTCKHIRQYRGDEAEQERLGSELSERPVRSARAPKISANGDFEAVTSEPGLLLAHPWKNDVDLTGWWMSEKLDGVRAFWDGTQFISRQGNVFHAPEWFIDELPVDIQLDGELWLDRKAFQRTVSIVRRQDKNDLWKEIRYVVFDAPGIDDVFEARMAFLQEFLDERQPRFAQPHLQIRCQGLTHLREELARVEALGGEGLMMRKPGSRYEAGRSFTLLKVKTFHDAEARVIEHLPGTGKHAGRLGALVVEMTNGIRFSVGTGFSDAERESPPAIGSLITFSYQELSDRGVPRFPSFLRVRTDVSSESAATVSSTFTASDHASTSINLAATVPTKPKETEPATPRSTSNKASVGADEGDWNPSTPRCFEFTDDSSRKFWEIHVSGKQVIVRFGRIGSDGLVKPKAFGSTEAAVEYAHQMIKEKMNKGYLEVSTNSSSEQTHANEPDEDGEEDDADAGDNMIGSGGGASVYAKESVRPIASGLNPTPTSTSPTQAAPPPSRPTPSMVADTLAQSADNSSRRFEFDDGSSSKFWEVKVVDKQVIVRFGKIGTDGQVKPKPFPSAEAASKYSLKIIEEKLAKGYEEVAAPQRRATSGVPESNETSNHAAEKEAQKQDTPTDDDIAVKDRFVDREPDGHGGQPDDNDDDDDEEEEEEEDYEERTSSNRHSAVSSKQPASASSADTKASTAVTYLELDGKFWEVQVSGKVVLVRTGEVGSTGQTQKKPFPSETAAQQYAEALAASKIRQGWTAKK